MNEIIVTGRIVQDLNMKHTTNSQYCRFRVAVPRKFDKETSDFFTVTVWGKPADVLMTYAKKGSKMLFAGEMRSSQYEEGGKKRTSYEIVASEFEFLDARQKAETKTETAPKVEQTAPDMDQMSFEDDDLPFTI